MHRAVAAIIGLVVGYVAGAGLGLGLVHLLSANTHDKSVEMATTAGLVTGPAGALAGLFLALYRYRRSTPA